MESLTTRVFARELTNIDDVLNNLQRVKSAGVKPAPKKKEILQPPDFSHFTSRLKVQTSDSEVFALAFNRDATLIASANQNGSLQIVSTLLGEKIYTLKDD